jgi:hypothetical protein
MTLARGALPVNDRITARLPTVRTTDTGRVEKQYQERITVPTHSGTTGDTTTPAPSIEELIRMSRPQRVLAIVVLVLGLALSTEAPASALTVDEAVTHYLAQVCPQNPAIDAVNRAVFRGKHTFRARQMHGKRLRQSRRALRRLQRIEILGGNHLLSPPSAWPTPEVAQAMTAVGHALVTDGRMIVQLRKRAGRRFVRYWNTVWIPHEDVLFSLYDAADAALGVPKEQLAC